MNTIVTRTPSAPVEDWATFVHPRPELDLVASGWLVAEIETLAWDGYLVPGSSAEGLLAKMDEIYEVGDRIGIRDVKDLVIGQRRLLAELTGFDEATGLPERGTTGDLHIYRNLLLGMAVFAAGSAQANPDGEPP